MTVAEKEKCNERQQDKRAKMAVAEKEKCNRRKRDKKAKKTVSEEEARNKNNRDKRATKTNEKRMQIKRAKGLISNEDDWSTTPAFAIDEAQTERDGKYRDSDGRHYLLKIDKSVNSVVLWVSNRMCKEKTKIQRTQKKNWFILVIFVVVLKGTVKGISDYHLPKDLEMLYTSNKKFATDFRKDARMYNNAMAMCSVTAQHGWRNRAHNNKMDSMFTAGGQLLRRAGPLITRDGEQPECVQTYFYGGNKATKWRMLNMRKSVPNCQRANYERGFSKLHAIMIEADNKYIKSFLGVKEYVETHLKDKIWDINLTIHANSPATTLKHKGRLNAPTVDKIAILLPGSGVITKKHKRYVTVNYRQKPGTNQLEFIPDYHRSYDPLQYVPSFISRWTRRMAL